MASILVLEDDSALRRIIAQALTDEGHTVLQGEDGFVAYDTAVLKTIDVMVTDLVMPGIDGLDAIRTARASRDDLKVIAMSGGSQFYRQDYLGVARVFGADDVLRKPFEPEALVTAVNTALAA